MIVIGFDPGSLSFGVGVLKKEGNTVTYVYSEEIKFKETDFYLKMKTLWRELKTLYEKFPIDSAAIEEGFLGKNVKAMNVLSKVRGVVLGSLLARGIPLKSYSPREVKLALTGTGGASKAQVGKMISILLNLNVKDKSMGSDESDALAVAYCHILGNK